MTKTAFYLVLLATIISFFVVVFAIVDTILYNLGEPCLYNHLIK